MLAARVCPSFRLSRRFLGIVWLVFSKSWHGARNPYEVVRDRAWFSRNIFFPKKLRKWVKNGPKTSFFKKILNNFVINFYWICSVMKIGISYCVPAQIPYLRKFWFPRYGSFIKRQASGTSSDNEWYNKWQRVTANDNNWYNEWQPVAPTNEKWQRVAILAKLPFFKYCVGMSRSSFHHARGYCKQK